MGLYCSVVDSKVLVRISRTIPAQSFSSHKIILPKSGNLRASTRRVYVWRAEAATCGGPKTITVFSSKAGVVPPTPAPRGKGRREGPRIEDARTQTALLDPDRREDCRVSRLRSQPRYAAIFSTVRDRKSTRLNSS